MKTRFSILLVGAALAIVFIIIRHDAQAQESTLQSREKTGGINDKAFGAQFDIPDGLPVFVAEIPPGYRDWKLISVAHEKGNLNDLRSCGQGVSGREASVPGRCDHCPASLELYPFGGKQ